MRKPWTGVCAATLMAAALAVPAHAQELHSKIGYPDGILCIAPEGGSGANGVSITTVPCDPAYPSYFWYLQYVRMAVFQNPFAKEPLYWIRNSGTGKCLDLTDGRTADWTPLQQWDCTDTDGQLWAFSPMGAFNKIKNFRSRQCMDVRAGSGEVGAIIQNYRCANLPDGTENLAQLWAWGPH